MSQGPANRLAEASSPYLQLHAHNPVDWYPWGEEALRRARDGGQADLPLGGLLDLLLVPRHGAGVVLGPGGRRAHEQATSSTSKWTARNDPIWTRSTWRPPRCSPGRAGWPNSVFLTPELLPFYAGTYFPPEDRYGRPGFPDGARFAGRRLEGAARATSTAQAKLSLGEALRRVLEERAGRCRQGAGSRRRWTARCSIWRGASTAPGVALARHRSSRRRATCSCFTSWRAASPRRPRCSR